MNNEMLAVERYKGEQALKGAASWLTKQWTPAVFIGLAIYALDSLIFLIAKDWIGFGFHVFAAAMIIGGYSRYRKLHDATESTPVPAPAPQMNAPTAAP